VTEDVTQHNGLSRHDVANLRFFTAHRSRHLVDAARVVTNAGGVAVLVVVGAVAAVLLWRRGAALVLAMAPLGSLVVAAAVATVAKKVVGRARPPLGLRLVNETEPSFPSGHTTDATALYLCLALVVAMVVLRRPLARALTVAVAVLMSSAVGASRLVLGVHWPTDVIAGFGVGCATAVSVTLVAALVARTGPARRSGSRVPNAAAAISAVLRRDRWSRTGGRRDVVSAA
jgi:membrane-associated phospholipid phosphatase